MFVSKTQNTVYYFSVTTLLKSYILSKTTFFCYLYKHVHTFLLNDFAEPVKMLGLCLFLQSNDRLTFASWHEFCSSEPKFLWLINLFLTKPSLISSRRSISKIFAYIEVTKISR